MLKDEQINLYVRIYIAKAIEILVQQDDQALYPLVALLTTSDIRDTIHHVLWTLSRRNGVRILLSDDTEGGQFKFVKW